MADDSDGGDDCTRTIMIMNSPAEQYLTGRHNPRNNLGTRKSHVSCLRRRNSLNEKLDSLKDSDNSIAETLLVIDDGTPETDSESESESEPESRARCDSPT